MEIKIHYNTNQDYWKIKDELKNKGYKLIGDAYWVQIFEDDQGNKVIATRN